MKIKYPTFKSKGTPTPNNHLVVCTHCGQARWTIYTKNIQSYCFNCEKRMREATTEEYIEAKKALKRII